LPIPDVTLVHIIYELVCALVGVTVLSGTFFFLPLAYLHIVLQQSWSRLILRVVHIPAQTHTHKQTQLQTPPRGTSDRN